MIVFNLLRRFYKPCRYTIFIVPTVLFYSLIKFFVGVLNSVYVFSYIILFIFCIQTPFLYSLYFIKKDILTILIKNNT